MGLGKYASVGLNKARGLAKRAVVKEVPRSIVNPLGYQTTKLVTAGLAIGSIGWGVGTGILGYREGELQRNAEYVGNIGPMDYDAVPNVDRRQGKRDFGATGDMVFGLNNMRRG